MADLDARGGSVRVGGAVFRTPGIAGTVNRMPAGGPSLLRAGAAAPTAFDELLAAEGFVFDESYRIEGARSVSGLGPAPDADDTATLEVEVDAANPGWAQVAILVDDSGALTWHFADEEAIGGADDARAARGSTRGSGGGTQTFSIPLDLTPRPAGGPPHGQRTRGLLGAIGDKILQFVLFRTVEKVAGVASDLLLSRWEARHRPYRVRSFAPDTFADVDGPLIGTGDWSELSGGRGSALLMLHGTFSRAHSAFGALPRGVVAELHQRYGGRVFAFDHPTMTADPAANIAEFVRAMPEGQTLNLDIIGHSRGGLVARMLAERQSEISLGSRRIDIRRLVLVATPNAGTALAEPAHIVKMIDRFSTLLTLAPDIGFTDILAVVVNLVKHVAVGATGTLDGLTVMRPGSSFLTKLNTDPARPPDARYYTIGSDYDPEQGRFAQARDFLIDKIFGDVTNDLVVPTAALYDLGASGLLPTEGRFEFTGPTAVTHTAFFDRPDVHTLLRDWLPPTP